MRVALCSESLDGGDAAPLILDRERETRKDALAISQHGACPTRALIAALLRARELQALTQEVQQGDPRIVGQAYVHPIHGQGHAGVLFSYWRLVSDGGGAL